MKTLVTNSKKLFSASLFVMALLAISCDNSKGNATQNQTEAAQEEPKVDLHAAVITNNVEAVKQHIKIGSDLNVKDPFGGSSPLITAALFGRIEIAKLLIESGVDLNFKNNDGSTALHTAAFFCRKDVVKLLLDKGIDKSIRNNFGATALESVSGPFPEIKGIYEMMGKQLAPMGLQLDLVQIEKMRPEIAKML